MKKLVLIIVLGVITIFILINFFKSSSKNNNTVMEEPIIEVGNDTISDSLIRFKTETGNAYFLMNGTDKYAYLYAEIKAAKYEPKNKKRAPLNISLVIDRSGSMAGEKLKYVKEAAKFVIDNLGADDYLSVVIYDDDVDVLFQSKKISNKNLLKRKIDLITDRGSTNLSGGMIEGFNQVESTFKKGYVNRVLLLSDGLANEGITDEKILQSIAKKKNKEKGITISTFGVGADFNEDMMQGLAENGSGNYYFIKSPDEIPIIFGKELKGLLSLIAQNAMLNISLPESLKLDKVFGNNFELKGNVVSVNFRDIFSEETKAVLIRFDMSNYKVKQINFNSALTFEDVVKTFSKINMVLKSGIKMTTNKDVYLKSINKNVAEQIILFESNELLEMAMKAVDEERYDDAKNIVKQNSANISKAIKEGYSNSEIIMQDSVNASYGEQIKSVESMEVYDKKMMQKGSKSRNYMLKKKKGK